MYQVWGALGIRALKASNEKSNFEHISGENEDKEADICEFENKMSNQLYQFIRALVALKLFQEHPR